MKKIQTISAVLLMFSMSLIINCASLNKTITDSKSVKNADSSLKLDSIFVIFKPVKLHKDDEESFKKFLEILKTDFTSRGIKCATTYQSALSLDNTVMNDIINKTNANYVMTINFIEAVRRSDSPWLAGATMETSIIIRKSGKVIWKMEYTFTHSWSGWGTFGEEGAKLMIDEIVKTLRKDSLI